MDWFCRRPPDRVRCETGPDPRAAPCAAALRIHRVILEGNNKERSIYSMPTAIHIIHGLLLLTICLIRDGLGSRQTANCKERYTNQDEFLGTAHVDHRGRSLCGRENFTVRGKFISCGRLKWQWIYYVSILTITMCMACRLPKGTSSTSSSPFHHHPVSIVYCGFSDEPQFSYETKAD